MDTQQSQDSANRVEPIRLTTMGRIIKEIEIEGQPANALFDSGATYTYVRASLVTQSPRLPLRPTVRMTLGGQRIEIRELCYMYGKIEGLDFTAEAVPLADLGTADGHTLDVIIGARTMEQWEILLDPKKGTLGLEGLRRREFTEY